MIDTARPAGDDIRQLLQQLASQVEALLTDPTGRVAEGCPAYGAPAIGLRPWHLPSQRRVFQPVVAGHAAVRSEPPAR